MIKRLSRLDIAMIEIKKKANQEDVELLIEHLKNAYEEIERLEDDLSRAESIIYFG